MAALALRKPFLYAIFSVEENNISPIVQCSPIVEDDWKYFVLFQIVTAKKMNKQNN